MSGSGRSAGTNRRRSQARLDEGIEEMRIRRPVDDPTNTEAHNLGAAPLPMRDPAQLPGEPDLTPGGNISDRNARRRRRHGQRHREVGGGLAQLQSAHG